MGQAINNFIQNFQDMFILKVNTLRDFPNNLSSIELDIIDQQLSDIGRRLEDLVVLSKEGSKDNLKDYQEVVKVLEDKLEYIEDLSDMLLYLNSFYDMNNILDIVNYDLRNLSSSDSLIFDNEQKGLTLFGTSSNFECNREITNGSTFTYYNSNLSYHSGIILHSDFLENLQIKNISLIRGDGLTLKLPINNIYRTSYYIKHDYLSSTRIIIEFNININALPLEEQEYYKSLKVMLVDYNFEGEGSVILPPKEYKVNRSFTHITNQTVPNHTYINLCLDIDLLDINNNKIRSFYTEIGLGSHRVCNRLNNLNFNNVKEILGIYINNKYKENLKNKITKEYLESLDNKNEVYVVYLFKEVEENNYYVNLNNQGLVFKNKSIKNIRVTSKVDFFSFNSRLSPILKILTGISKDE